MPEGITTIGEAIEEALCLILARHLPEEFRRLHTQLQAAIQEERQKLSEMERVLRTRRASQEVIVEARRRMVDRIGMLRRTFLGRTVALLAGR
jgi:small-conductance mechanosensitive channel